jgi:hypothetical protein
MSMTAMTGHVQSEDAHSDCSIMAAELFRGMEQIAPHESPGGTIPRAWLRPTVWSHDDNDNEMTNPSMARSAQLGSRLLAQC